MVYSRGGGEKVTIATKIAGNMTVYARWEKISDVATYTVTLNPTGGNVSPTSIQVIMGKEIGTLPTPTRNGYSFKGWYTAANGGTAVNMTMKVTSNMTIYAHWESLAAESRFKKGKLWYKVVKPALSTSKEGTVSVVGPVNKNLRKATIPLTVKSGSFTYKVVSVAKFAFKNNKS